MLRVIVDGSIFERNPHGGIARVFTEVLTRIANNSKETEFLVFCERSGARFIPRHDRIRIFSYASLRVRPSRLFARVSQLQRYATLRRIAWMRPALFVPTYYTQSPFRGLRTVVTLYDFIMAKYPSMLPGSQGFAEMQANCLKSADHIVSISDSTKAYAVEALGIPAARISTVHLAASEFFSPATEGENIRFRAAHTRGRPFLLFVGTIWGYKNLGTLVRAFADFADREAYSLVVAGHVEAALDEWLTSYAISRRIENRILRLVRPSDRELRYAYSAASAFVYPSLDEGFGIPLLEAMRCGTPVIASDIPPFHEVCGDAALFFDPHDASALADCLSRVLVPGVAASLRASGLVRARLFSWDVTAERMLDVYRHVVQGGQESSEVKR